MKVKKIAAVIAVAVLFGAMLTACGKKDKDTSGSESSPSDVSASASDVSGASKSDVGSAPASGSGTQSGEVAPADISGAPAVSSAVEIPPLAKNVFIFTNKTGVTISKMQLAPTGTQTWQDVVLGYEPFTNSSSLIASMNLEEATEMWDLKITGSDGNELVLSGLKMSEYEDLELVIENGELVAYVL